MKVSLNWLKEYVDIKVAPMVLAEKLTMAGLEVTSLESAGSDTVFEIEVTANRADCLSMLGIAQEAAAVLGKKLKRSKKISYKNSQKGKDTRLPSSCMRIKDKKGCSLYRACLLGNVKVGASPSWLRQRIEALGIRSINNVVDITNYCLLEYGQPLHAFDHDKLSGGIIVRRAIRGEKILTIDGVERNLTENMLLVSDHKRGIAIAGVMGDKLSEVGMLTKAILLESAYFDPVSIRRTSRALGLSTESSYRFERGVDFSRVVQAQDKAVALLIQYADAQLLDIVAKGSQPMQTKHRIEFSCQRANDILSLALNQRTFRNIFESLGFLVKKAKKDCIIVEVPSFRRDVKVEEDLFEECARIYGYHKIPSTMPAIRSRLIDNNPIERIKKPTRQFLCGLGFDEVITYNLINKAILSEGERCDAVRLYNPLSSEHEYLRPSLVNSMLGCLAYNLNRSNKNIRFFEISHIVDDCFQETMSMGLLATGEKQGDWRKQHAIDFYTLKGALETLIQRLGFSGLRFTPLEAGTVVSSPDAARIICQEKPIGIMGSVRNADFVRHAIKCNAPVFYAEISLTQLCSCKKDATIFEQLPVYPSIERDMSLIVKDGIAYEEVMSVIESIEETSLKKIRFTDRYRGKQIPPGCTSITVSLIFCREERTLTDREIDASMERIVCALKTELNIVVRSL